MPACEPNDPEGQGCVEHDLLRIHTLTTQFTHQRIAKRQRKDEWPRIGFVGREKKDKTNRYCPPCKCRNLVGFVVPLSKNGDAKFQSNTFSKKSKKHNRCDHLIQFHVYGICHPFSVGEVDKREQTHAEMDTAPEEVAAHAADRCLNGIG